MDGSSEQLVAAHERKMLTYAPLLVALQVYLDEGWQVEIFPWVVGVRGLLDSDTIKSSLEFLEIHWQHWRRITEDAAASLPGSPLRHSIFCIVYASKFSRRVHDLAGCMPHVIKRIITRQ